MTPCSRCGIPTAVTQNDLFNADVLCLACVMVLRVTMILDAFSGGDDWEHENFENLNEWEQEFLVSIRQQFARKGAVSEKQYEILERLWKKVNS